ncbi:MAG: hypothetical protein LBO08_02205 [Rickettsiales bacterium]|jgi:hypothetical protein|nr:hypothetical protein [Rickettsiales bacterium]
MKSKILIITACAALSACAGSAPKTALEVQNGFKCQTDEFSKTETCISAQIEDSSESLLHNDYLFMHFAKSGSRLFIQGSISTRAGALVRDTAVVKAEKALDSNGKQFVMENAKKSETRICMSGTCYMYAPFELVIDKKWLEQHKASGSAIKVYTDTGLSPVQNIPAHYIQGFLDYLNSGAK